MRHDGRFGVLAFVPVILAVAACNQTGGRGDASASVSSTAPAASRASAGSGCAGDINSFRTVITSDVQTGNVNRSVYERVTADLDRATGVCNAGRDAEATRLVSATKQRHGYP